MLELTDRTIDLTAQRIRFADGRSLPLTTRERDVLAYLSARPSEPVSREQLLVDVWKVRATSSTRAVDVALFRLRQKIEVAPDHPVHLISIQFVGYKFVPRSSVVAAAPVPVESGLPVPPTALVGRQAEVEAVRAAFAGGARLVTLVGTGGAGKSRVALALAHDAMARGIEARWVPLGEGRTTADLASAVVAALGTDRASSETELGPVLRARGPIWLVLDGFEALVAQAAVVARWLDAAPELRVLVASRKRLRILDERVVDIGPLSLDDARTLFLARVAEAGVDPAASGSADALIEGLERLPLALELAAPRARVMSYEQIRSRLAERFELLGPPPTDPVGRSLKAMLQHSFGLLGPAEQRALGWCSTFAGGFTLDAAEAVLGEMGTDWPIDLVEALCDASLVRLDPGGATDPRYRLYDSVRDFASAWLAESGGTADAERAHARYYLELGRVLADGIERHGGVSKLGEMAAELDNLLEAHARTFAHDGEGAARLVVALEKLLASRGPTAVLEALVDQTLADPRIPEGPLLAEVLCVHAEQARNRGRRDLVAADYVRAHRLAEKGSEPEVRSLIGLALVDADQGRMDEGRARGAEATRLAEAGGFKGIEALAASMVGTWDALAGDLAGGARALRRAIRLGEEHGNGRRVAVDRANLASVLREVGELEEAERQVRLAIGIDREWGNRRRTGFALQLLAMIQAELGQVAEGLTSLREASSLLRSEGYVLALAMGVQEHAILTWMATGDAVAASAEFERAVAGFREIGQRAWQGNCLAWRAAALAVSGELRAAEEALDEAGSLASSAEEQAFVGLVRAVVAARHAGEPSVLEPGPSPWSHQRLLRRILAG